MNKQKQKQQKISYISLMAITIAMTGMFIIPNMILPSNAQNTTITDTIDVETVKPHLDDAKKAFDSGNYAEALKHIDLAENQLDIADDLVEAKLGQN
jgi:hypothetical protein